MSAIIAGPLSTLEHLTKGSLAAAGLAYVCGVLILNVHLGQHGFPSGDLAEPRYVATGALWLFVVGVHSVLVVGAKYVLHFAWHEARNITVSIAASFLGIGVLAVIAAGFVELSSFSGIEFKQSKTWYAVVTFTATALIILPTRWIIRTATKPAENYDADAIMNRFIAYLAVGGQVLLLLVGLVVYAVAFYPRYPAAVGGGTSVPVFLAPSPDRADSLSKLGFPTRNGLIGPADLLFEDSSAFYVVIDYAGYRTPARLSKDQFYVVITGLR
jgi:hypothetical protein